MHKHGGDIYTYKNVLDFSANTNFRGMPDAVRRAAEEAVARCGSYPDVQCGQLKAALSKYEEVPADWIICGNDAADLIFTLAQARKPRKALLPIPGFYEYEQALQAVGCQLEKYRLTEKNGFRIQEDFLERMDKETDMVFLCNPNNPTGILTEPEFLERLLRCCERCGALLVVDECFNEFLDEPGRYSMKSRLAGSEHLFLLKAFTKMYAMAGLRLGYGICSCAALLGRMERVRQPWSVSIPAQAAGIAAVEEREFVKESRAEIKKEREFLAKELRELGYQVLDASANYIFFQAPRGLMEICLLRGFLIRDCSNYEGLSVGWYRIAVRSHEDNLKLIKALRG